MFKFLITEQSSNRKTGPIMVTTSPRETCPSECPFKGSACYAEGGPLRYIWSALDRGTAGETVANGKASLKVHTLQSLLDAIGRQAGKLWRMNQAGDLPGHGSEIRTDVLRMIVRANREAQAKGFTYTHKPVIGQGPVVRRNREAIAHANRDGFTINLSANNLEHADQLADLDIGPVVTVLPSDATANAVTPKGRKVVVCPATQRDDVSCATCGLCARQRDAIVGFPAHGAAKRKASQIAATVQSPSEAA